MSFMVIIINITPVKIYGDKLWAHFITKIILRRRLLVEHERKQCIKCKCLGFMQLRAIYSIGQTYPKAYQYKLQLTIE